MTRRSRSALCALSALVLPVLACDAVLSIEKARLDPSLEPGSAGGDGNSGSSSAGTQAISGSGGMPSAGSSSGGSSGAATGGTAGAAAKPVCEEYCEQLVDNCDPDGEAMPTPKQYADTVQCLAACSLFPAGEVNDRGVNSIYCRLPSARTAKSEPATDCPRAGPAQPENGCGTSCEAYCSLMMGACNEQTTGGLDGYFFQDNASCMSACAAVPDTQPYLFAQDALVVTGNHLACRLYHVIVATESTEHCEHAAGISLCVDP